MYRPLAHARATDPETSHDAAYAVADAPEVKRRVYGLHRAHPDGLSDERLLRYYAVQYPAVGGRSLESKSSPRKRRSDLTAAGVLIDSGRREVLSSGRRGVIWVIADAFAKTG